MTSYIDLLPIEIVGYIHYINRVYYANIIIKKWRNRNEFLSSIMKMKRMIHNREISYIMVKDYKLIAHDDSYEILRAYNYYDNMYFLAGKYINDNLHVYNYVVKYKK